MDLYTEYETCIRKLFREEDKTIAHLLETALLSPYHEDIYMALAWSSGNLRGKFPETGKVLFKLVKKFEYGD